MLKLNKLSISIKMQKFINTTLLVFVTFFSQAQNLEEAINIAFEVNGKELSNGLTGGLNAPQISSADLNNDGLQDIVIFDRIGNVFIPLLHNGGTFPDCYTYAPKYKANFPVLKNWVMLRDYDGDNVQDIFAYSTEIGVAGIEVHKGKYVGDELAFDKLSFADYDLDILSYPGSNGLPINLFVSSIDYPAIDDMDCDGDLDVLTFNPGGGYVELYKNVSVENGFGRDSLLFLKTEDCWGGIYESGLDVNLSLPTSQGDCANFTEDVVLSRHAGSCLLTLDADGDDDKELILGDLAFTNLTMLVNNGSCSKAYCNEQVVYYPEDQPADLPIFPAAFYLDVDTDGVKDLVASPNNINNSLDIDNVHWWKNNGADDNVSFEFKSKSLFVDEMIDLGTGTSPVFADVNADGLLDLVVGTVTTFVPYGDKDAGLYLFLNKGTSTDPIFELTDDNWLNFKQYNSDAYSFSPTFGDLDSDGDLDLLVGEAFGYLFYGENKAEPGEAMKFTSIIPEYKGIDVGQVSTPLIYDLDKDGLQDLIIGERNGNINFFKNIGTATAPAFNPDQDESPNSPFLGAIDLREEGFATAFTAPVIIETLQETYLISGSQSGKVYRFDDILSDIYADYTLTEENLLDFGIGDKTRPAFADIDNDGNYESIIGNDRGGLSFYQTDIQQALVSVSSLNLKEKLNIFPNPANDIISINHGSGADFEFELYDTKGSFLSKHLSGSVSVGHLSPGVYVIKANLNNKLEVVKFVKY